MNPTPNSPAKLAAGPCLIVAERIDEILQYLLDEGLDDHFHPSYTRMVPAHYVVELSLLGCPDPNPTNTRLFAPRRNRLTTDLEDIGRAYIGMLAKEIHSLLDHIDSANPIGVLIEQLRRMNLAQVELPAVLCDHCATT